MRYEVVITAPTFSAAIEVDSISFSVVKADSIIAWLLHKSFSELYRGCWYRHWHATPTYNEYRPDRRISTTQQYLPDDSADCGELFFRADRFTDDGFPIRPDNSH